MLKSSFIIFLIFSFLSVDSVYADSIPFIEKGTLKITTLNTNTALISFKTLKNADEDYSLGGYYFQWHPKGDTSIQRGRWVFQHGDIQALELRELTPGRWYEGTVKRIKSDGSTNSGDIIKIPPFKTSSTEDDAIRRSTSSGLFFLPIPSSLASKPDPTKFYCTGYGLDPFHILQTSEGSWHISGKNIPDHHGLVTCRLQPRVTISSDGIYELILDADLPTNDNTTTPGILFANAPLSAEELNALDLQKPLSQQYKDQLEIIWVRFQKDLMTLDSLSSRELRHQEISTIKYGFQEMPSTGIRKRISLKVHRKKNGFTLSVGLVNKDSAQFSFSNSSLFTAPMSTTLTYEIQNMEKMSQGKGTVAFQTEPISQINLLMWHLGLVAIKGNAVMTDPVEISTNAGSDIMHDQLYMRGIPKTWIEKIPDDGHEMKFKVGFDATQTIAVSGEYVPITHVQILDKTKENKILFEKSFPETGPKTGSLRWNGEFSTQELTTQSLRFEVITAVGSIGFDEWDAQ